MQKPLPAHTVVGHDTLKQGIVFFSVVMMHQVSQLMDDDIINQDRVLFHQFTVE